MTAPWVIVTADLVRFSGQGMANLALAEHLAGRGTTVHVVAHRCEHDLLERPRVRFHRVLKPIGSGLLGERLLARAGRRVARAVTAADPRARVLVNGGNCEWGDVNWVHMVHRAWTEPLERVSRTTRLRLALARRLDRRREARILSAARVLIANSHLTRRHLIELLGLDPARVRVVYLGIDPARFGPLAPGERERARADLGLSPAARVVAAVGGLGHDRRKGFDHLLAAWPHVVRNQPSAVLLVAGGGAVARWRHEAVALGVGGSIRFLSEVPTVPRVLAAADLLVSPTRYDAYGMNVHEAVCRGVPALVARTAGVAERFPPELAALVTPAPGEEDGAAYARRILEALSPSAELMARYAGFGAALRARTWDDMAAELVAVAEERAPR